MSETNYNYFAQTETATPRFTAFHITLTFKKKFLTPQPIPTHYIIAPCVRQAHTSSFLDWTEIYFYSIFENVYVQNNRYVNIFFIGDFYNLVFIEFLDLKMIYKIEIYCQ